MKTKHAEAKKAIENVVQKTVVMKDTTYRIGRFFIASKLSLLALMVFSVVPLTAFEAHVVNVTATIVNRFEEPKECPALSIGYWSQHEGCKNGLGTSAWTAEINALSAQFSGVFASSTGTQLCNNISVPKCPGGNAGKLCKAKAHVLADELNVVSGKLDLNALLAGADDGSTAFDNLGLVASSKVFDALATIEDILKNQSTNLSRVRDADYVAERIYAFYEDENPRAPWCIFHLDDLNTPVVQNESVASSQEIQSASDDAEKKEKSNNRNNGSGGEQKKSEDAHASTTELHMFTVSTSTSTSTPLNTDTSTSTQTETSSTSSSTAPLMMEENTPQVATTTSSNASSDTSDSAGTTTPPIVPHEESTSTSTSTSQTSTEASA